MNDPRYWERIRSRALDLGCDGCTWALEVFRDVCLEHDIHYHTHKTLDGQPITKQEADEYFLDHMREKSKLGQFSPMAYWRYLAVKLLGWKAWSQSYESHQP